jgi:hypothetical protein
MELIYHAPFTFNLFREGRTRVWRSQRNRAGTHAPGGGVAWVAHIGVPCGGGGLLCQVLLIDAS